MVKIKEKILEAGLSQFLKNGKAGATTKAIAEEAGVNKALIHYYYSSKDLLFDACVEDILKSMEETFRSINVRSIEDYQLYIETLIDSYCNFTDKHDKHLTFLIWEYLNDKELLSYVKNIMGTSHLLDFLSRTETAIKKGIIKPLDPLDIYLNLVSLVLSTNMLLPITLSFLGKDSELTKIETINRRKKEIVRILWNDIKGD